MFPRGDIEALIPLDVDANGSVTTIEFDLAKPALYEFARELLETSAVGYSGRGSVSDITLDDSDGVHFRLHFPVALSSLSAVSAPVLPRLSRGHRQYLSVRAANGELAAEYILSAAAPSRRLRIAGA